MEQIKIIDRPLKQAYVVRSMYYLTALLCMGLAIALSGCGGPGALNLQKGLNANSNNPSGVKRVFISENVYNGNLGGLDGADAMCTALAQYAKLGGIWKAWLSSSTQNAFDRIQNVGPWYTADGRQLVFNNKAQLNLNAPILMTENLHLVPDTITWTGTYSEGTANTNFNLCQDWTSTSGESMYGDAQFTDFHWTQHNHTSCTSQLHIYCIEQ